MNELNGMWYGFTSANRGEEPAWFHTQAAAERFNAACGGQLGPVQTTDTAAPEDILDTIEIPWVVVRLADDGMEVKA